MSIQYYGASHVGLRRRNNQDSICFLENGEHALLAVVCDGIGGGLAGDVASRMAIEHMKESFLFRSSTGCRIPYRKQMI